MSLDSFRQNNDRTLCKVYKHSWNVVMPPFSGKWLSPPHSPRCGPVRICRKLCAFLAAQRLHETPSLQSSTPPRALAAALSPPPSGASTETCACLDVTSAHAIALRACIQHDPSTWTAPAAGSGVSAASPGTLKSSRACQQLGTPGENCSRSRTTPRLPERDGGAANAMGNTHKGVAIPGI